MYSVIFISTKSRRSNLTILNVEGEQTVVCAPIIYLTVNAVGDLTNVPTEWVQISGSPTVTIETVSQTEAYYLAGTNVGTDKTFRFYIHRNTSLEQYVDLIIRTTPRETITSIPHGVMDGAKIPDPMLLLDSPEISSDFTFDTSIRFNAEGHWITDNIYVDIPLPELFTKTTDPLYDVSKNNYHSIIAEEWTGSTWVLAYTFNRDDTRIITLTNTVRLRYGVRYNRPGLGLVTYYSTFYDYDMSRILAVAGKEVIATMDHGILTNAYTISRLVFTLIPVVGEEHIYHEVHGILDNNVVINRIVYILIPVDGETQVTNAPHGVLHNSFTITRTSGTTIGG